MFDAVPAWGWNASLWLDNVDWVSLFPRPILPTLCILTACWNLSSGAEARYFLSRPTRLQTDPFLFYIQLAARLRRCCECWIRGLGEALSDAYIRIKTCRQRQWRHVFTHSARVIRARTAHGGAVNTGYCRLKISIHPGYCTRTHCTDGVYFCTKTKYIMINPNSLALSIIT